MPVYLTKPDVIRINIKVMQLQGSPSQLLNEAALDGAIQRPQTAAYYQGADITTQASVLFAGIALAHAFLDGNKRTSLIAGVDFLIANEYQIVTAPLELAKQIEGLVNRQQPLDNVMQTFNVWLQNHCSPN